MKNLAEIIRNFDREQACRVAHNLPEQYTERAQTHLVAQISNGLFVQLAAASPARLVNRSQEDVNEIRRQWVLAFKENGITTLAQVEAGMRMVHRQASSSSGAGKGAACRGSPPLTSWLSTGGGVSWCSGTRAASNIRGLNQFFHHICLELRRRGTDGQLSHKELEREASDILDMWEKRVLAGKPIPPVRRALVAPVSPKGPTPAELLKAKYERLKTDGVM